MSTSMLLLIAACVCVQVFGVLSQNEDCAAKIPEYKTCLRSPAGGSGSEINDIKGSFDKCYTDNSCTPPTPGSSRRVRSGARKQLQTSISRCVAQVKREDVFPKIQSCMTEKIPGFTPEAAESANEDEEEVSDVPSTRSQLRELKRTYSKGIKAGCSTRANKRATRQCVLRTAKSGKRGGGKKNEKKLQRQCARKLPRACRDAMNAVKTTICECAKERIEQEEMVALAGKLDTCVKADLGMDDLSIKARRALLRAKEEYSKCQKNFEAEQKGRRRNGRRRGGRKQ